MSLNLEALEVRENPAALNFAAVPPALFQTLATDVSTLITSASRASPVTISAFLGTTFAAFSDGTVSSAETSQIVLTASQVLIEANVPPSQLIAVVLDVQAIAVAAGVGPLG
jgi:hypothetical protein